MLVVGDREAEAGEVGVRRHGKGDQGAVSVEDFSADVQRAVLDRT
jgi:threonyl-tRNA synthetase